MPSLACWSWSKLKSWEALCSKVQHESPKRMGNFDMDTSALCSRQWELCEVAEDGACYSSLHMRVTWGPSWQASSLWADPFWWGLKHLTLTFLLWLLKCLFLAGVLSSSGSGHCHTLPLTAFHHWSLWLKNGHQLLLFMVILSQSTNVDTFPLNWSLCFGEWDFLSFNPIFLYAPQFHSWGHITFSWHVFLDSAWLW